MRRLVGRHDQALAALARARALFAGSLPTSVRCREPVGRYRLYFVVADVNLDLVTAAPPAQHDKPHRPPGHHPGGPDATPAPGRNEITAQSADIAGGYYFVINPHATPPAEG
jgi:hypothetical protein